MTPTPLDPRTAYVAVASASLLAVGVWHLVDGPATERAFAVARNVRVVGAVLLVASIPCALWRGWYFDALGVALAASGVLRFFFAERNIRLQKTAYPRWVHGCIMSAAAIAMGVTYAAIARQ